MPFLVAPGARWHVARLGISQPSQMRRLLVMSMEPCAVWRLRRFGVCFKLELELAVAIKHYLSLITLTTLLLYRCPAQHHLKVLVFIDIFSHFPFSTDFQLHWHA